MRCGIYYLNITPWLYFAADSNGLRSFNFTQRAVEKGYGVSLEVVCYGHSGSFKIFEIYTNRKPICDFILVLIAYLLSFLRYSEFFVKNPPFRLFLPTQSCLNLSQGGSPGTCRMIVDVKQEAQLWQRDRATLRVIDYIAKPFKIIRNDTVE